VKSRKTFLFSENVQTRSESTQFCQYVSGVLSIGAKVPEQYANHSPPSTAVVKNEWSYTTTPFISLHIVQRNNFNSTFI
jgi:hypothetical protein